MGHSGIGLCQSDWSLRTESPGRLAGHFLCGCPSIGHPQCFFLPPGPWILPCSPASPLKFRNHLFVLRRSRNLLCFLGHPYRPRGAVCWPSLFLLLLPSPPLFTYSCMLVLSSILTPFLFPLAFPSCHLEGNITFSESAPAWSRYGYNV